MSTSFNFPPFHAKEYMPSIEKSEAHELLINIKWTNQISFVSEGVNKV